MMYKPGNVDFASLSSRTRRSGPGWGHCRSDMRLRRPTRIAGNRDDAMVVHHFLQFPNVDNNTILNREYRESSSNCMAANGTKLPAGH
jgi:hypothetical protein